MPAPRRGRVIGATALSLALLIALGGGLRGPAVGSLVGGASRRISQLLHAGGVQESPPPAAVILTVDGMRSLRAISPLIYGVSVANQAQLTATGARLNRWGGNPNTRYNWANGSAWNAARDWEFRNYGGAPIAPSSSADGFVEHNRLQGVESMLTIPAIGWVARNGDSEARSVGVPQLGGPPLGPNSEAIAAYDPAANQGATSVRSLPRKGSPFED